MRTLSFLLIFAGVTALGTAFHRASSGQTEAAPVEPRDVAVSALEKGDSLRQSDPRRAMAFYRACLALEGTGEDPTVFARARERLASLEPRPTPAPVETPIEKPQPRKGVTTVLAAKPEVHAVLENAVVPVKTERPTVISVGPDGLIYDAEP